MEASKSVSPALSEAGDTGMGKSSCAEWNSQFEVIFPGLFCLFCSPQGCQRDTHILLIVSSHPILSSLHGLDSFLQGGKCSASVSVLSEGAAAGMLLAVAAPEALMSALALWQFGSDTHKLSGGLSLPLKLVSFVS